MSEQQTWQPDKCLFFSMATLLGQYLKVQNAILIQT